MANINTIDEYKERLKAINPLLDANRARFTRAVNLDTQVLIHNLITDNSSLTADEMSQLDEGLNSWYKARNKNNKAVRVTLHAIAAVFTVGIVHIAYAASRWIYKIRMGVAALIMGMGQNKFRSSDFTQEIFKPSIGKAVSDLKTIKDFLDDSKEFVLAQGVEELSPIESVHSQDQDESSSHVPSESNHSDSVLQVQDASSSHVPSESNHSDSVLQVQNASSSHVPSESKQSDSVLQVQNESLSHVSLESNESNSTQQGSQSGVLVALGGAGNKNDEENEKESICDNQMLSEDDSSSSAFDFDLNTNVPGSKNRYDNSNHPINIALNS